jgi:2-amino-4-hydroxy-6-hydroxymethyldihydropteridine diphosphokinase
MDGATSFVGLGSNLGDRLANLQRAVDLLSERDGITVRASSRVYATDPVPPTPPQPEYLNAVVAIETTLEPYGLLDASREVENALGRERLERWGPRTIDVDVLVFDERTIDEPELVVPHPRMLERPFVLVPLAEIDADPMLPGGHRLAELRTGTITLTGVRPFAPPLEVPR